MVTGNTGLAFDTQTGQLCRTWDWAPTGKAMPNPITGKLGQAADGESTRTCQNVYRSEPTTTQDDWAEAAKEYENEHKGK